jgi:hypothetical protein
MTGERIKRSTRALSGLVVLRGRAQLLALLFVSVSACLADEPADRSELPAYQRQFLTPERLPEELKRVRDGVLVRVPLAEFDERVELAKKATGRRMAPRLVEARYRATLKEEALVGEGQWKLIHTGPSPGLLNLQPFNLALRKARIEKQDALIAAFDDKTPALLVETEGEKSVSLEWSARAEAGPEGLRFLLEVPPCPVAVLDLDVPADRAVTVLDDALVLSGPFATESPDLRRWQIVWRGRDRIDFRIRPAERPTTAADQPVVAFVRQTTTQKLYPEGLDATFELALEASPRGVSELVCECDPELRLRDVVGPGVDRCTFQTGDGKAPSRLTIRLRKPLREGTWKISCLAPLARSPAPTGTSRTIAWRSPGLRLIGGVPRGEALALWIHPNLHADSWEPGGFRLVSSTSEPDFERQVNMQHLTLLGGGVSGEGETADATPRRPEARLEAYGVEYRAHQLAWLRCDAAGLALTLQIGYEVSQGQLFQLPVLLPPDWTVESVGTSPAILLREWRVRTVDGRSTLYVDLARPLVSAEQLRREGMRPNSLLTIHLRPTRTEPVAKREMPFPDAVPLGARFREGAMSLDCDEQLFHLDAKTTADRSEPDEEGPWGKQTPEYYYRYRGVPVTGTLRVQLRPPRLRAKCGSEVFVASGRAAVETHLLLEAEVGSPETIDLSLSEGGDEPWQWRNEPVVRGGEAPVGNRVLRAERLYFAETADALQGLAAQTPLEAAALFAARPGGEHWRLTLAQPLRARQPLRLHAMRSLQPRPDGWHVPLPVVLGAARMEGEVTLHLAGADVVQVHSAGLSEAVTTHAGAGTPWRTFRYGQTHVGLTLSGRSLAPGRATEATIDRARLTTRVGTGDVLQYSFSFQVANWRQRTLPLRLPPGSRPLAVQIDGYWLPRLVSATPHTPEDGHSAGDSVELALPVPARGEGDSSETVHRFEVVYTRPASTGLPWQFIESATPILPVIPLSFHRRWLLPPGLIPLRDSRYQPIPGMRGGFESGGSPRRLSDIFHSPGLWTRFDPFRDDDQTSAALALNRAVESLRGSRGGQTLPLQEVVSDLAFVRLKDSHPLIVDSLALREAGVGPNTPLTIKPLSGDDQTPPWAECGLVAVPARSGIVLTTASGHGGTVREPLSASLEQALAAAVVAGQDPSGRFRIALTWLPPEDALSSLPLQPRLLDPSSDSADWSEWEPVAGLAEDTLIAVRPAFVTAVGFALTLVLGLFFWAIRRRPARIRLVFLLLSLAVAGLGLLWLPAALRDLAWWPLLAGCGGTLVWYLRAAARSAGNPRTQISNPKIASAVVLLLVILGWNGRAAAPEPVTVYLVPGPPDAPENQTVLAPADFLDQLRALARPAPLVAGGPQAVLLDAVYEGKLQDDQAEFTAVFSVQCLTDDSATLAVPLGGVQLVGDIRLDGARAVPLALPAPQSGYSLQLRSAGRHKVELRFRAPVAGTPEDRNVLFRAPPLVRSRLNWHIPPGATDTHALVKYGGQWTVRDGGDERLEVDLGRLPTPLHLHWHQAPRAARPARIEYQAAYLWDLHLEASRLNAWLRYRISEGSVRTLEVDLPGDLEVLSADAQRTRPVSAPAWLTRFRLRDWQVRAANGKRTLRLQFPYPVAGDFQVTLELVPHTPLPAFVTLPFPPPQGERSPALHYLAYRTHPGLEARRDNTLQNITRIGDSEFAPGWPGVSRPDPRLPGAAYKISADRSPILPLHLRPSPTVRLADLEVSVHADRQLAQIQAAAKLEAPNKDLGVVEWDLQSHRFTIASVAGKNVRAWKQTDSRLLVWLQQTTAEAQLTVSGWLPLERREGQAHLDLPCLRLPQAREQQTRLRLLAAPGLALASVKPRNLAPSPVREAGEYERTFETRQADYGLACEIQSAANAIAHVLTFAEVNDRQLQFTIAVNYEVRHGELRRVDLRLRNWEAERLSWEAERWTQSFEPRRAPGDRSLVLDLQPGVTRDYRVVLRGSIPVEEAALGAVLPDVSAQGVEHAEYTLAVAGRELVSEARGSLEMLANATKALSRWPGIAERVERTRGVGWRHASGAEWQLRLLPQTRTTEPARVQVFLLEQSAAVVDGRRWLHEARCWVRHEGQTDLNVVFPAPARVITAAVDGAEAPPLQPHPSRLWLPLPGRIGVRCIRLRWIYNDAEPLDHPSLLPPTIVDAIIGPSLWTLRVPSGWEVPDLPRGSLGEGAARTGARALYRAEAQLRISQEICKQARDSVTSASLAAAQRRFALYSRVARHAVDVGANHSGVRGPNGQTLVEWLRKLQSDNRELADHNGFEDLRAEAERQVDTGEPVETSLSGEDDSVAHFTDTAGGRGSNFRSLPQKGTPITWLTSPEAEPPVLRLVSHETHQTRSALASSGQWLGLLAAVWGLSFLPFLTARLRPFWPEQIALLGVLGWYLVGLTLTVLVLVMLALCGRVFLFIRGVRSLLRKHRTSPSAITPGNAQGS